MYENHEFMGGKLGTLARENSLNWQCSTFLAGKNCTNPRSGQL